MKQLRASGESSDDLRTHLFKAYGSSPDKEFTTYIGGLKDDIRDNGTNITAKQLMSKAKLKATDLERERNLGTAQSRADEQILALEARVEALSARLPKGKGPRRTAGNGGTGRSKQERSKTRKAGKQRTKQRRQPFPEELKKAAAPANPKVPREINGIKYYYCEHHKKWGEHPTSACKAKSAAQGALRPGGSGGDQMSRLSRAAHAIAAVATGED